jgi:hypothetical protein
MFTVRTEPLNGHRLVSSTKAGAVLRYACAIKAKGQIVGTGDYKGETHDFLLTPSGF